MKIKLNAKVILEGELDAVVIDGVLFVSVGDVSEMTDSKSAPTAIATKTQESAREQKEEVAKPKKEKVTEKAPVEEPKKTKKGKKEKMVELEDLDSVEPGDTYKLKFPSTMLDDSDDPDLSYSVLVKSVTEDAIQFKLTESYENFSVDEFEIELNDFDAENFEGDDEFPAKLFVAVVE